MMFARRLREGVMNGDITCSIRVWHTPRVRVGGRYALGPGAIHVTSVREIAPVDITEDLAIRSGFETVADLLQVARHGSAETIYLVEFTYQG